jgi:hypothetical protein
MRIRPTALSITLFLATAPEETFRILLAIVFSIPNGMGFIPIRPEVVIFIYFQFTLYRRE